MLPVTARPLRLRVGKRRAWTLGCIAVLGHGLVTRSQPVISGENRYQTSKVRVRSRWTPAPEWTKVVQPRRGCLRLEFGSSLRSTRKNRLRVASSKSSAPNTGWADRAQPLVHRNANTDASAPPRIVSQGDRHAHRPAVHRPATDIRAAVDDALYNDHVPDTPKRQSTSEGDRRARQPLP